MKLKFDDMPYGTRFKYPRMPGIYVVISKFRKHSDDEPMSGTVARWDYGARDSTMQGIFLYDPAEFPPDFEFEVVDHIKPKTSTK